ncbi:MAG TPA: carboxypeptidase-like regulatory domain-containing protein [Actinokineospora sp.]|nr:carboxypeptidase-like regulatory domain-containing protein [Actinokineospora sp.]
MTPGEPGIGDVLVTLSGIDALGRAVDETVASESGGAYTFPGVVGGTYAIGESHPLEYLDGRDAAGSAGGAVVAPDTVTDIPVGPGVDATAYTFGEARASTLSGLVTDEAGGPVPGVRMVLTEPDGSAKSTTTGDDGAFTFRNLAPGRHTLTETQPEGYTDGPETVGSAGGDPAKNDVISGIKLTSGTQATGYVFAERAEA